MVALGQERIRRDGAAWSGPRWGRWKRKTARKAMGEDGQSMVETAFVLPTFFLLLFGLFEFGILLFGYENCTYAARTAARWASLHSTTSIAPCNTTCVTGIATPLLYAAPSGGITVNTTYGTTNVVGGTVTVTVKIAYTIGIPYFKGSKSFTVASRVVRTITR